jgi:hypothetical protein
MKIINLLPLFILLFISACTNEQQSASGSEGCLLIDKTDSMYLYPTADDMTKLAKLKEDPWQSFSFTIATIEDKDITNSKHFSIDDENAITGELDLRYGKIAHLKKDMKVYLDSVHNTKIKAIPHSIIYKSLCLTLNDLANKHVANRYLIACTDWMENSYCVNFYDTTIQRLLVTNPTYIKNLLEKEAGVLPNLQGIHIYFVYSPKSYEDNAKYRLASNFFEWLLKSKGAIVHLGLK